MTLRGWGRRAPLPSLLLVLALLYLPFLPFVFATDHDALAMLGYLRSTGSPVGWPDGFFLNSFVTSLAHVALSLLGLDDLLLTYKLVVVLALLGLAAFTYRLARDLAVTPWLAAGVALVMATLPGLVSLLAMFEDNILASLTHVQYLYVFIRFVGAPRSPVLRRALPLSLLLAVLGHHQNGVVLVTPLFLWWLLPEQGRRERLETIARIYAAVLVGFVLVFALLTVLWDRRLDTNRWLEHMLTWFVPNQSYRGFHFFARFGWDLPRQAAEIGSGVSRLFCHDLAHAPYVMPLYALLVLVTAYGGRARGGFRDAGTAIVVLFLLIHVPHALIDESASVERWDVLLPPLALVLALLLARALAAGTLALGRLRIPARPGLAIACAAALAYNLASYAVELRALRAQHDTPQAQALLRKLHPEPTAGAAPRKIVLLLNEREFGAGHYQRYMVAQTYYDYTDSIFALFPDGRIYKSGSMYLRPIEVSPAALADALRGARLVMNEPERTLLGRLDRPAAP